MFSIRFVLQIGGLIIVSFVTGCAALPNEVDLVVRSDPSGANVVSSDGWSCTTPCTHSVTRESQFDLEVSQVGFTSETEHVQIPEIERSNTFRHVGAGAGFLFMLVSADLADELGSALIDAFFGEEAAVLSTGEKIGAGLIGGGVFGGIGYAIDRMRDEARAKRPIEIQIELEAGDASND